MPESTLIGLISFLAMTFLAVWGIPIYIIFFVVAFVGFWLLSGPDFMLIQFSEGIYNIAASYSFAVIPLFVLMGEFAGASGVIEAAYEAFNKWIGHFRGGMLMTTVGAYAAFGATSGVPVAAMIIFSKLCLPEIEKYRYEKPFAMACIAAGGILTILIPPSIPIVILCILVNLSIGKALVAGIVPGILTLLAFCITIWIVGLIYPQRVPKTGTPAPWKERIISLKLLWPILIIFLLVTGGIYAGIFPPTVGGAIGASGTLIYALARRTPKNKLWKVIHDTILVNAQIFPLILGGFLCMRLIALSGIANYFSAFIASVNIHPMLIMTVLLLFYVLMGIIGDVMPVMIITLPVVFPLVTSLGFDPYAFLIVLIFMQEIGGLSPPMGMPVFIVAGVAKVNPMVVFKGVWPFIIAMLILCFLFIMVPSVVTWLPNLFYK